MYSNNVTTGAPYLNMEGCHCIGFEPIHDMTHVSVNVCGNNCKHYNCGSCSRNGTYTTPQPEEKKTRKLDDLKDYLKKKDRRLR